MINSFWFFFENYFHFEFWIFNKFNYFVDALKMNFIELTQCWISYQMNAINVKWRKSMFGEDFTAGIISICCLWKTLFSLKSMNYWNFISAFKLRFIIKWFFLNVYFIYWETRKINATLYTVFFFLHFCSCYHKNTKSLIILRHLLARTQRQCIYVYDGSNQVNVTKQTNRKVRTVRTQCIHCKWNEEHVN